MRTNVIKAIAQRDLLIVIRSRGVVLPMILLPVILMVLLPTLLGYFAPLAATQFPSELDDIKPFLDMMPDVVSVELTGYDELQTMVVVFINYMFAPLFLVMPLMVASNIAANSFAGEKERKTLEVLLYTPTTDAELFVGKFLSAWIPAVLVAVMCFFVYGLSANLAAWSIMHQIFFPNIMWIILVIWLSPAAAALGLGTMVLVSSKARTYQEASQIGGVVVLPVVLLVLGQLSGVLYFSAGVVLAVGSIVWLIDALILWMAIRTFRRSAVIAKL
jgi:ABC-2 type transport system permease protein